MTINSDYFLKQHWTSAFGNRIRVSTVSWELNLCSFIHSVVCLMTGPQALPQPVLHTVRSSTSSCNFQYLLFSLRPFRIVAAYVFLLVFPPLLSFPISIFPSINCFRRQFLHRIWPIQVAFLVFIVCKIFFSAFWFCVLPPLSHTFGQVDRLHPSPGQHLKTFLVFMNYFRCQRNLCWEFLYMQN